MANKVSILVYGTRYPISTREDPQYVLDLGHELDKAVKALMSSESSMSLVEALVLLSMNYLDSSNKANANSDHLREQVADYLEEASKARLELAEARAELETLKRDYQLKMGEA